MNTWDLRLTLQFCAQLYCYICVRILFPAEQTNLIEFYFSLGLNTLSVERN